MREALVRWKPRSPSDRELLHEALMDLVVYPFDRGVEEPPASGIFVCNVGRNIVIVFVPAPEPDERGDRWLAVIDIAYGEAATPED